VVLTLPDPDAMVVRDLLADLLSGPEANRRVAAMIAGTDVRYPMPGALDHPLLGARAPGVRLPSGRGALLADAASAAFATADGWTDRVDRPDNGNGVGIGSGGGNGIGGGSGIGVGEALLVRPDGHVCWAGRDDETDGLHAALTHWFGAHPDPARLEPLLA
jgi:hypothetical protein